MSKVIKKIKIDYSYQREDGIMVHSLSHIESFCGHTNCGGRYVGVYIHKDYDENGGAFHVFKSMFPVEFSEVACFRYEDYSKMTLLDLENTLKENIDYTFTLDEVADDISIFIKFMHE